MLRRFLNGVRKFFDGRELVGTDKNGNKYYRWKQKEPTYTGRMIEKREVDFAVRGEYDPLTLPPEWLAWLHKFRKEPPTVEECQKIEQEKAQRAARVAALEVEEQKRKQKLSSLQSEGMTADVQPNMQRYIEQLTNLVIQVLDGQDDALRRDAVDRATEVRRMEKKAIRNRPESNRQRLDRYVNLAMASNFCRTSSANRNTK